MTAPSYVTVQDTGTDNDADQAVDQLVDDVNALYETMYQVGLSQDEVDDLIDQMLADSNTSSMDSWTNPVDLDMILTLLGESNTIAGGLCFISQSITVIADLTNLATVGQNAFMDMCDNADDDDFGTSTEGVEDAQELQTSLNAFNETEFTIHYADGSTDTVTGILNLLSNNSLEDTETDFWGDSGMSPMDASSASLINTSVDGITQTFTDWDDYTTYFADIQEWSSTTDGTGTSEEVDGDTEYIQETSSEISDINNSFGQIDSQLETNSTELSNDLSYGMTLYEQFEGSIEEIIDSMNTKDLYIIQQTGA